LWKHEIRVLSPLLALDPSSHPSSLRNVINLTFDASVVVSDSKATKHLGTTRMGRALTV
jgi:hypothetical protein